ncbi:hypothetical protein LSAT2_017000, partial [Lamellibrachia satsuma]
MDRPVTACVRDTFDPRSAVVGTTDSSTCHLQIVSPMSTWVNRGKTICLRDDRARTPAPSRVTSTVCSRRGACLRPEHQ